MSFLMHSGFLNNIEDYTYYKSIIVIIFFRQSKTRSYVRMAIGLRALSVNAS